MIVLFSCFQILGFKIKCKVKGNSVFINLRDFTEVNFLVGSHNFDEIISFDTLLSFIQRRKYLKYIVTLYYFARPLGYLIGQARRSVSRPVSSRAGAFHSTMRSLAARRLPELAVAQGPLIDFPLLLWPLHAGSC